MSGRGFMNNIKVSVIVPIYNAEKYIKKCVESILNQSLKEIELILVNDGSTDASYSICQTYAEKDKRIVLLDQVNAGVSVARNNGLNVAKGKYIEFVDADDYIESNTIEILYKRAVKSNSDTVIFGIKNVYSDNESFTDVKDEDYTLTEFLKHYGEYISNAIIGATWNKLYRRELIEGVRFIEGKRYNEDLFFNLDALKKCKIISLHQGVHYNYIHNADSVTSKYIENLFEIYAESNKKAIQFLKETSSYDINASAQSKRFVKQTIAAILMILANNDIKKEKISKIKKIFNNDAVRQAVAKAIPSEKKEKILFFIIKHKMSRCMYFICKTKKRKQNGVYKK